MDSPNLMPPDLREVIDLYSLIHGVARTPIEELEPPSPPTGAGARIGTEGEEKRDEQN